jgi:hypothetical protein
MKLAFMLLSALDDIPPALNMCRSMRGSVGLYTQCVSNIMISLCIFNHM